MVGSYEQTSDAGGRPDGPRVRIEPVQWDGEGRVALIGEIDIANVDDAEAALTPMAASGAPLVLDLVGLTYCDSQGVAMLFRLARQAPTAVARSPLPIRRASCPASSRSRASTKRSTSSSTSDPGRPLA